MISLSGWPNTLPGPTSFSTSRSQPLRASLACPSSTRLWFGPGVSAANPTSTWRGSVRAATRPASTSGVCTRSTARPSPPDFLILVRLVSAGVKSAGAAAITTTSAPLAATSMAAARSAVETTRSTSTPRRGGASTCAATTRTVAPRRLAARASAQPIRPEEALPRKRTGSRCSRVPPALMATVSPARSRSAARRGQRRVGQHGDRHHEQLGRVGQPTRARSRRR